VILYRMGVASSTPYNLHQDPKEFEYEALVNASNGFKDHLGEGGGGEVYLGEIEGQKVAIKRLVLEEQTIHVSGFNENSSNDSEGSPRNSMKREVEALLRYREEHLVRMIGYTKHDIAQPCIVYEYLENKDLRTLLDTNPTALDWRRRLKIARQIARAIEYLHDPEPQRPLMIHRDVKTDNILLTKDFDARLSDFGLGKIMDKSDSSMNRVAPKGAYRYLSPEYNEHGILSPKIDVFAFGVVLAELLTGKPPGFKQGKAFVKLHEFVIQKRIAEELMDSNLKEKFPSEVYGEMARICLSSLEHDVERRATMKDVAMKLKNLDENEDSKNNSEKKIEEKSD